MKNYIAIFIFLLYSMTSLACPDSESNEKTPKSPGKNAPLTLKHEVFPKVCKPGVFAGPAQKFNVYVFCDDGMGTTIAIVTGNDQSYFNKKWNLDNRFWQDKQWGRDVNYFAWSKDGRKLKVETGNVYGTCKKYELDLINQKSTILGDCNKDS